MSRAVPSGRREGMFLGSYCEIFGRGERLGCILNLDHSFDVIEAHLLNFLVCRYTLARFGSSLYNVGARSRIISHLGTWDYSGRSRSHRRHRRDVKIPVPRQVRWYACKIRHILKLTTRPRRLAAGRRSSTPRGARSARRACPAAPRPPSASSSARRRATSRPPARAP